MEGKTSRLSDKKKDKPQHYYFFVKRKKTSHTKCKFNCNKIYCDHIPKMKLN